MHESDTQTAIEDRAAQLSAISGHCAQAELAADEQRWDDAQAEAGVVHDALRTLLQSHIITALPSAEAQQLQDINARLKRLSARVAVARGEIAERLTRMRKRRSAALAYQHNR